MSFLWEPIKPKKEKRLERGKKTINFAGEKKQLDNGGGYRQINNTFASKTTLV